MNSLLTRASGGDVQAAGTLFPMVYGELQVLARRAMRRERGNHTLQSTALVNEVFLKLVGAGATPVQSRGHFFALASQAIRRILVDHARQKARLKRGGSSSLVALTDVPVPGDSSTLVHGAELVELDEALAALERAEPRKARVVEMRFFGGMTTEEIAMVLDTTTRTVERDWQFARAWLYRRLAPDGKET